jgi:hypothetical protein
VLLLDTLLIAPITFVLRRIAEAVDAELNDEGAVREELLALQMRRELGEIDEEAFAAVERELLRRLREIREAQTGPAPAPGEFRVTGIEASTWDDEDDREP